MIEKALTSRQRQARILAVLHMKYRFIMGRGVPATVLQFKGMFEQIDIQNEAFLESDRISPKMITQYIKEGVADGELHLSVSPEQLARTI